MNTLLEFGQLFGALCLLFGTAAILAFAVVLCCFIVSDAKQKMYQAYLDMQREDAQIYKFHDKED